MAGIYLKLIQNWRIGNMVRIRKIDESKYSIVIEDQEGVVISTNLTKSDMENLIREALSAISPKITLKNPKLGVTR